MQQRPGLAGHEAVRMEEILFHVEAGETSLQVTCAIPRDPVSKDEILSACRRPDRIGLHETEPSNGVGQCCGGK